MGDVRDAGNAGPPSSLLVVERHVHVGIVLELVELVRGLVCYEKQVDLCWFDGCHVVRDEVNYLASDKTYDGKVS